MAPSDTRNARVARPGEAIGPEQLSARVRDCGPREGARSLIARRLPEAGAGKGGALRDGKARYEARYIAEVQRQHRGNVTRSARALGMSRVTLYRMRDDGLRSAD